MPVSIIIAHDEDEGALAEELASPLRVAGYQVVHEGTVMVGDSIVGTLNQKLASGAIVVVCGTKAALGNPWPKHLAHTARSHGNRRLYLAKMHPRADAELLAGDDPVAHCYDAGEHTRAEGVARLVEAIRSHHPLTLPGSVAQSAPAPEVLTPEQQTYLAHLLALDAADDRDAARQHLRALAAPLAATTEHVTGLKGLLLHRHALWVSRGVEQRFVNLYLVTDHGERAADQRFTYLDSKVESLAELLARRIDAGGWLLKGEPGCGKSTVLQHHELTVAEAALRALVAGQDSAELCLAQRLSELTDDAASDIGAWLVGRQQKLYPRWPGLQTWLASATRVRWLLDGLNEIASGAAGTGRHGVALRLSRWAESQRQRMQAPVFSVRTQDFNFAIGDAGHGFEVHQARIEGWTDEQIKAYCSLRGPAGAALWQQLQPPKDAATETPARRELRDFCRLPINLDGQCDLVEGLGRPATDRAELNSGLAWRRLRREHGRHGDAWLNPHLLTDLDRRQVASESHWHSHLLQLPDEGDLVRGLDAVGCALHQQGAHVSVPAKALPWPSNLRAASADWRSAVKDLGLGEVELGGQFRFTHQLWQEFFAARGLSLTPDAPIDLSPPPLRDMAEVNQRGLLEPLPGPGVSRWEEAAKMAVQLAAPADAERWVRRLRDDNLALAARATLASRSAVPEALQHELRQRLLTRSRDAAVDLRLRIEAGLLLGDLGDPRYEDHGGWRWPDADHWVTVPAGAYRIGAVDGDDEAYGDERPATTVRLEAFRIAFAPVTNAEYRCFVEDRGYQDEQWWQGEDALTWLKKGLPIQEEIDRFRPMFKLLREEKAEAFKDDRFSNFSAADRELWLTRYAAWTEQEAENALQHSFGGRPAALPGEWFNADFNRPSQPVVGVSAYEAEAYARWLSQRVGEPVRLPTEAEWEAAARPVGGSIWPWGTDAADDQRFNHEATRLRRVTPVGVFPRSDTPASSDMRTTLVDMVGNAWEWTASDYAQQGHSADALVRSVEGTQRLRVLRGGAWSVTARVCRVSYRGRGAPADRHYDVGFRLVRAAP